MIIMITTLTIQFEAWRVLHWLVNSKYFDACLMITGRGAVFAAAAAVAGPGAPPGPGRAAPRGAAEAWWWSYCKHYRHWEQEKWCDCLTLIVIINTIHIAEAHTGSFDYNLTNYNFRTILDLFKHILPEGWDSSCLCRKSIFLLTTYSWWSCSHIPKYTGCSPRRPWRCCSCASRGRSAASGRRPGGRPSTSSRISGGTTCLTPLVWCRFFFNSEKSYIKLWGSLTRRNTQKTHEAVLDK